MTHQSTQGLRENWPQFSLLMLVNACVGAMLGQERSILPAIASHDFHLATKVAILSFILVFGLVKALTNYLAGRWADQFGRKHVLIAGWLVAIPVPFLLMWAPSWYWIIIANVLLGISQGLTWSITVVMKIDLVGAKQRGLAMGLNEFAGYIAVAASALFTGWIASHVGLRPQPFYPGLVYVGLGLLLSLYLVRDTQHFVRQEVHCSGTGTKTLLSQQQIFWQTSIKDKNLSSITQAGLINNLNDGMAWGLFPIVYAAAGINLAHIGLLMAIYPAVWGISQIATGALSDKTGRKWMITLGMWLQACGIAMTAVASTFNGFAIAAVLLGAGTAMVYPTLLAAIGDVAAPSWRASAIGVYRLWRDMGYVAGALIAGLTADLLGLAAAIWLVAMLTALSGLITAIRLQETQMQSSVIHG